MAITISGQNNNDKILASDGVLDQISGFNVVGVLTTGSLDVTNFDANHINVGSSIQLGNAGIITATTLIGNVTGNVNSTSNLLLQISGSEKFRVGNGGQLGIGGANYGTAGQVFTSGGSGSAPTWSTINSDKITEGNTEAEVVDTGSDGHFKITTEGNERLRITSVGTVNIGDADHVDDEYLNSTLKIQKDQNSVTRFTMRNEDQGSGSASAVQIGAYGNSWMLQCGSTANDSNAFTIRVDGTANGNTGTERFRLTTAGAIGLNGANYGTSGQVLTSQGGSSAPTWTTVSGTTINNNADNRIITGSGTANTLEGEANMTFDGSLLTIAKRVVIGNGSEFQIPSRSNTSSYTPQLQITGAWNNPTHGGTLALNGRTDYPILWMNSGAGYANGSGAGTMTFSIKDGAGNYCNTATIRSQVDGSPGNNDSPGRLGFMTTPDGTCNPVERMRIHSTGLVSVGEDVSNSHDYKFVVKPNRTDSTKAALGLLVDGDSGQGGGVAQEAISAKFVNTNTFNNATHQYAVYITAGQQYTAPVTGCYASAQGVYGQTNVFDGLLQKGVNAATDGITFKSNIVQTGTELGSTYHMRCYNNSSERLRITLGGNIQNTNNSYGQISDVKHKENIVDASSQWDDIKNIKVRKFNFKESSGFETHTQIGVVAQELETISPGLIDITNDTEIDESTGEGKVTGTTKYVKYSILYMKAVKCLQEAQARIETLEAKVDALEGS